MNRAGEALERAVEAAQDDKKDRLLTIILVACGLLLFHVACHLFVLIQNGGVTP